ncbi:MAG: class I SAM-dependent rRNA methyltransferase [Nitrospiraceae bacterium]
MASVRLRASCEHRIVAGHLWIYEGDIDSVAGEPKAGDVVEVTTHDGRRCGLGLYSPQSKIRVRLLTSAHETIDASFWDRRIGEAVARRTSVISGTTAYRLVHSEGDGLPGLIVDRYGPVLVMQTLTVGMDRWRDELAEALLRHTDAESIYLRNDAPARVHEGLPSERGFLRGEGPLRVEIAEGPARFLVDIERGQKTGWFCDQRDNRLAVAASAKDRDVLDAFCHTGAFGTQSALGGARSVSGLDVSRSAVEMARMHADLNGVAQICEYRQADAQESLKRLGRSRRRFDLVILDPPAFAKSRSVRGRAVEGYRHINMMALNLIRSGGLLVTCSCSHHVGEDDLSAAVEAAARQARRRIEIVERRGAGPDHPVRAAMPETRYLKCLIAKVK